MKNKLVYRLGLIFFVVSCALWLPIAIVPFLPLTTGVKAIIAAVSAVLAEICFWIAVLLIGKEVVHKYRSYLNPKNWKKNKKEREHE